MFLSALAGGHAIAAAPEWRDGKGATFRGEPVEALGPLLLFRGDAVSSRYLPMHVFSPEDCVRFYSAVAGRPDRAARWSEAKGEASREFRGALESFDPWHGPLQPFDSASVPEPELLIVLFGGRSLGLLLDDLVPFMNRVQRVYPGRVATVVVLQHFRSQGPPLPQAYAGGLPSSHTWLVVRPEKQSSLRIVSRFAPVDLTEDFSIVLMSRQGVPLLGGPLNHPRDVMAFVDGASDLLWQLSPANPRSARDRLHYLQAVRPVEFARGHADPLLLIDPFKLEVLRQRGVVCVEAKLEIGADGAVTRADLLPEAEMPMALAGPVTETLRRNAIFLPALAQGQPVAGTSRYTLKVEPPDAQLAADIAWTNGEARLDVPLKSWLVLKPIRVSEKVFSTIDRVGPDGTVLLKAVTAGHSDGIPAAAETNAFDSDWFKMTGGPASVRPVEGETQEVDDQKLVWKRMTSDHGFVDLLEGARWGSHDFCVGYAWTEFESPEAADAWLGIGSDDGLKVWLNGDLVDDQWVRRRSRLDDDVVPLRLKKGRNQFLIKVQNHTHDWSFTARLRVRGN